MLKKESKKKINKKGELPLILSHPNLITPTLGQRAADKITKWAGSWSFIISFAVILILWMVANSSWLLFGKVWDPHPFILLNLVLSSLAAFQAPIILMSQNRSNERDRQRAEYDYAVNRKAEREILSLKAVVDRIDRRMSKNE